MEKRKYSRNLRFITALFVVATISSSGAQAAMPALESGGETSLSPTLSRPTPQPGVVATPSAIMESTPGNERSFIGPVIEAVEVGFINRATGTAGYSRSTNSGSEYWWIRTNSSNTCDGSKERDANNCRSSSNIYVLRCKRITKGSEKICL